MEVPKLGLTEQIMIVTKQHGSNFDICVGEASTK